MVSIKKIIEISHYPMLKAEDDEIKKSAIVIGSLNNITFLIKHNNFNNISVKSKKYLKKKDLAIIMEYISDLSLIKEQNEIEKIDMTDHRYDKVMVVFEDNYLEMLALYNNI